LKSNALLSAVYRVDTNYHRRASECRFPLCISSLFHSTSSRNGEIKINKPRLSRQIYLRESQVLRSVLLKGVSEILLTETVKLMHASVVEIFLSATLPLAGLHIFLGRSHHNVVWICMGKVSYSYGVHYR